MQKHAFIGNGDYCPSLTEAMGKGGGQIPMMLEMKKVDALAEKLPKKDCGACGSPTCKAFARDVVRGEAKLEDCVVRSQLEG